MNLRETLGQTLEGSFGQRTGAWPPPRLSLALQGGGSFGAFTWGVLDRLLETGESTSTR